MSERAAVEEAVRGYLERRAHGDEGVGRLALDRVEVVRVTAERATAEIEASTAWDIDHPVHGRRFVLEDLSGPVELALEDGTWRVVDFTIDGRRRSRASTRARGQVERGDLRLQDVELGLGAKFTSLDFTVENRRARSVVVYEVVRGARVLGAWFYVQVPLMNPVEVDPGERRPAHAGWGETFPLDTKELRFVVRAGEVDGSGRVELHFAVPRGPEGEVATLGRLPWPARLSVRRRRQLQSASLVLVAVPLVLRWFRIAGIVLALEGVAVGLVGSYLWLVRRRVRPSSRFVVAVLVTIAFGVWLAWLDPS